MSDHGDSGDNGDNGDNPGKPRVSEGDSLATRRRHWALGCGDSCRHVACLSQEWGAVKNVELQGVNRHVAVVAAFA
jgi:hypothetical protein